MTDLLKISERTYSQEVLQKLDKYFTVQEQVRGTHYSGKRLIIDAIIKPRDASLWANKDIALGVEFKLTDSIREDARKFTGWVAQCVDYANTDWDEHGLVHVFACPGIDIKDLPIEFRDRNVVRFAERMMSQFGVGSLKHDSYLGHYLALQSDHVIWSDKYGVQEGKRWKLERKYGSR